MLDNLKIKQAFSHLQELYVRNELKYKFVSLKDARYKVNQKKVQKKINNPKTNFLVKENIEFILTLIEGGFPKDKILYFTEYDFRKEIALKLGISENKIFSSRDDVFKQDYNNPVFHNEGTFKPKIKTNDHVLEFIIKNNNSFIELKKFKDDFMKKYPEELERQLSHYKDVLMKDRNSMEKVIDQRGFEVFATLYILSNWNGKYKKSANLFEFKKSKDKGIHSYWRLNPEIYEDLLINKMDIKSLRKKYKP